MKWEYLCINVRQNPLCGYEADEEYLPEMESINWCGLVRRGYSSNCHQILIQELQEIHDRASLDHWEKGFMRLAYEYKLQYIPQCKEV